MKRKLIAAATAFALVFLAACGTSPAPETSASAEDTKPASVSETPESEGSTLPQSAPSSTAAPETSVSDTRETESEATSESEAETQAPEADLSPYVFSFDPYSLSSEYRELYGEEFVSAYRGLADAFINYETSCPCPSEEVFTALLGCVDSCMPYFASDAVLTYDAFDPDTKTLTIHYRSSTKEAHDSAYAAFVAAVERYFEQGLYEGDSDLIKAISIYRNFSAAISYDLRVEDVSAYGALMTRVGIAHSFAHSYAYLLRQAGIEANTCGGLSADGSAAHEWVVMKLGGTWFYADPTYENGETGGLGLSYFGTNNAERREAGYDPTYFGVGTTGRVWANSLEVEGNHFDFLRGSTSFVIDRTAKTLILSNAVSVDYTELPGGVR